MPDDLPTGAERGDVEEQRGTRTSKAKDCQHLSYVRAYTSETAEVGVLCCKGCGALASFSGDHVDGWQHISDEQLAEQRDLDERIERRVAALPPLDGPTLAEDGTVMWQRIAYWALVGTYGDTDYESAWSTPERAIKAVAAAIDALVEHGYRREQWDLYMGEDGLPHGMWWRIDRVVVDKPAESMTYASSYEPGETGLPAAAD